MQRLPRHAHFEVLCDPYRFFGGLGYSVQHGQTMGKRGTTSSRTAAAAGQATINSFAPGPRDNEAPEAGTASRFGGFYTHKEPWPYPPER